MAASVFMFTFLIHSLSPTTTTTKARAKLEHRIHAAVPDTLEKSVVVGNKISITFLSPPAYVNEYFSFS